MSEAPKGSLAKLLEVMIAEIGYVETPDNITKFGKAFRADGKPWCGSFQNWCEKQAGVKVINTVWTPGGEMIYKEANKLHKTPQVGDVGFMNFSGGKKPEHVARVIEVNKDTVKTIEGNTSDKSQSNGGMVMVKDRHISLFVSFGRPDFVEFSGDLPKLQTPKKKEKTKK
jgi:hypothetical protein